MDSYYLVFTKQPPNLVEIFKKKIELKGGAKMQPN